MKKAIGILIILIFCLSFSAASCERNPVVKDQYYLGAMRVVNCKEYVSLRETPDKTDTVLAKVPLDAIVLYCNNNVRKYAPSKYQEQRQNFIRCEYQGIEGYILKKHLRPAPECEPAETKQFSNEMTREEILSHGSVVLDWNEFNVSVIATYAQETEDKATWAYLRIGCFINDIPNWGYTEAVKLEDKPVTLKAFMGGTEDEPMVFVYDEEYGLTMLELMDGSEVWTILKGECTFGDASVITVGQESGILYAAGSDGPDPIAVSSEGSILWQTDIEDPEVYGPAGIRLNPNDIEVTYSSGQTVMLEYNGELISISDV